MLTLRLAITYRAIRFKDNLISWLAKNMPKELRYWAVIEACVEATTGQYSDTVVPELTVPELLQRIEK